MKERVAGARCIHSLAAEIDVGARFGIRTTLTPASGLRNPLLSDRKSLFLPPNRQIARLQEI